MASAVQELQSFIRFVQLRVGSGKTEANLDELFDLWRHENPSGALHAENVAAIAGSIDDFRLGERGTLAGQDSAELRREFGLIEE